MRPLELTRPRLAFVVMTRAALAAGVALLVSQRLPKRTKRILGAALSTIGVATTIPALGIVFASRRDRQRAQPIETSTEDPFTRHLAQLHT